MVQKVGKSTKQLLYTNISFSNNILASDIFKIYMSTAFHDGHKHFVSVPISDWLLMLFVSVMY